MVLADRSLFGKESRGSIVESTRFTGHRIWRLLVHDAGGSASGAHRVGDEVDELFYSAEESRFEVSVTANSAQNMLPRSGNIGLFGMRPSECLADPMLPFGAARNIRPGALPKAFGFHRLPDVDVRMSDYEHVRSVGSASDRVGDALFFRAGYEVIDEYAGSTPWPRGEFVEMLGEGIDALEVFDDDPFHTKIGAPHLLDEFGIVATLDEDAAGQCDPCAISGRDERARGSAQTTGRGRSRWPDELCRFTIDEKAVTERKHATLAESIFERHVLRIDVDDRATETIAGELDYEVALCGHLGNYTASTSAPVAGEYVISVGVAVEWRRGSGWGHRTRLTEVA